MGGPHIFAKFWRGKRETPPKSIFVLHLQKCGGHLALHLSLHGINDSEEPMLLIVNTGGEEKLVRLTPFSTIAEGQCPQLLEHEGITVLVPK